MPAYVVADERRDEVVAVVMAGVGPQCQGHPGVGARLGEPLGVQPIEEAVGVVKNVRQVHSISKAGQSDVVLEFNWAYGPEGNALQNKTCLNAITTGGSKEVYCSAGYNSFTVEQFLRPFEQTAILCGMEYFPPFAVMGTHNLSDEALEDYTINYGKIIDLLQDGLSINDFENKSFLNDIPQLKL